MLLIISCHVIYYILWVIVVYNLIKQLLRIKLPQKNRNNLHIAGIKIVISISHTDKGKEKKKENSKYPSKLIN